ncbi:MAG: hypothetical protein ACM3XS_05385 [Bacteroidota bacterium]
MRYRKGPRLGKQELRKRLVMDAASPGGIETALSRIGQPLMPRGEHLAEGRRRERNNSP